MTVLRSKTWVRRLSRFPFREVCVWAVQSVRVIKSKIAKKGLSVKRAQGCLHKEQSQVDVVVSNCVSVCMLPDQGGWFDHTLIVPVWVRPVGQPEKEILQYAVLGDHSNVSFVFQTLCKRFHLEGPSTELLLTTMQEQTARVNTSKISGLEVQAPEPLTPNHLLTMKPKRVLPHPWEFQRPDVYCRTRWRRVQSCANEFWLTWREEYLQMLQVRHKWVRPKKNLTVGDIVISKENKGARVASRKNSRSVPKWRRSCQKGQVTDGRWKFRRTWEAPRSALVSEQTYTQTRSTADCKRSERRWWCSPGDQGSPHRGASKEYLALTQGTLTNFAFVDT